MDIILLLILILNNKLNHNLFNRTNNFFFLLVLLLLNTKDRNTYSSSLKKNTNYNAPSFNSNEFNTNEFNTNEHNKKVTTKQNKKIAINKNKNIHTKINNSKNISNTAISNSDSIIRSNSINNKPKNNYSKNIKSNHNKYISILDEHTEKPYIRHKIDNFKNTYKKSISNSNSVNNKIHTNYSKNINAKINSNKFAPILDKNSKKIFNNHIIDSFKNTSDKTQLNSDLTTKSNSKHNYIKNNYIESINLKNNEISYILNEYYKGSTISIVVRDLGVITGNIVFNFDSVIALKLKNNITVFINKDLISNFF